MAFDIWDEIGKIIVVACGLAVDKSSVIRKIFTLISIKRTLKLQKNWKKIFTLIRNKKNCCCGLRSCSGQAECN